MSSAIAEVAQKHGHPQGSVVCICGCRYDKGFLLEKSNLTLVYSVRTVRERDDSGTKSTVNLEYPVANARNIPVIYDDESQVLEQFFKELPKRPGTQSE